MSLQGRRNALRRTFFFFAACLCLGLGGGMLFAGIRGAGVATRLEISAILLALLLHESGHILTLKALAARPFGQRRTPFGKRRRSPSVRLLLRPGGVELLSKNGFLSYSEQLLVATSGAMANFLTLLTLRILFFRAGAPTLAPLPELFLWKLQESSFYFALLNLLPIKGLDGGSATEAIFSFFLTPNKAERILRGLSFCLLLPLWLCSLCVLLASNGNFSFFVFCGCLFWELYKGQKTPHPFTVQSGRLP